MLMKTVSPWILEVVTYFHMIDTLYFNYMNCNMVCVLCPGLVITHYGLLLNDLTCETDLGGRPDILASFSSFGPKPGTVKLWAMECTLICLPMLWHASHACS
ncbi:unnamed protein product [Boreogadus saida]